ncbi:hypothetical protein, partial [Serratia marcescens]|uniref:hypothetical protein n=1 Tax=Serratia marcescens TaxID=615 RepID=UPI002814626F
FSAQSCGSARLCASVRYCISASQPGSTELIPSVLQGCFGSTEAFRLHGLIILNPKPGTLFRQ